MADRELRRPQLHVDGERLWARLGEMARIGAMAGGGCDRQALTDDDKAGRELFIAWCKAAGCAVRIDEIGNIFARREGKRTELAPVLAGSHLDTQPSGGRFDGVYGVLAGLEAICALAERDIVTARSIEIAVWTNEEGARFAPAMLGSAVFAGVIELGEALAIRDKGGRSVGEELGRIGFRGSAPVPASTYHAAFELHIEQGPILEAARKTIGIVTGVQGIRWYDITLRGDPVHAGPTPMDARRDVIRALPALIDGVFRLVGTSGFGRATFGDMRLAPGSRNTVPAELVLALDLRHPDEEELAGLDGHVRTLVMQAAADADVDVTIREIWHSPAVRFDAACIAMVRAASDALGHESMELVSGAGHDSVHIAKVAPTAMIFIPCAGGISHNPNEMASREDVAAGADVLLHALLGAAQ